MSFKAGDKVWVSIHDSFATSYRWQTVVLKVHPGLGVTIECNKDTPDVYSKHRSIDVSMGEVTLIDPLEMLAEVDDEGG